MSSSPVVTRFDPGRKELAPKHCDGESLPHLPDEVVGPRDATSPRPRRDGIASASNPARLAKRSLNEGIVRACEPEGPVSHRSIRHIVVAVRGRATIAHRLGRPMARHHAQSVHDPSTRRRVSVLDLLEATDLDGFASVGVRSEQPDQRGRARAFEPTDRLPVDLSEHLEPASAGVLVYPLEYFGDVSDFRQDVRVQPPRLLWWLSLSEVDPKGG
jgi:hypothetical protein